MPWADGPINYMPRRLIPEHVERLTRTNSRVKFLPRVNIVQKWGSSWVLTNSCTDIQ